MTTGARLACCFLVATGAMADAPKTLADLGFLCSPTAKSSPAAARAIQDGETALHAGPWSVTDRATTLPGVERNDYLSVPPYWWPNPDTPDGLPYVNRDGEVNPERKNYDNVRLNEMCRAVESLALAHALSGDAKFAARATLVLDRWFVTPESRMNPNFNFSQGVPGRSKGRPEGIIDGMEMVPTLDAIDLLILNGGLPESTVHGVRNWFSAYLDWLLTHPFGKWERNTKNNHATCFDVQAVRVAYFVGRDGDAKAILDEVATRRINVHIQPDGAQPREMSRTRSFDYALKNLSALMDLADMGRHAGLDLWHHTGPEGQSIRKALDFVLRHSLGGEPWPVKIINDMNIPRLLPVLQRGCIAYANPSDRALLSQHAPADWAENRVHLLYPLPILSAPQ